MADRRKLEKTGTPGVYRRHAPGCARSDSRCGCGYIVRWKYHGRALKRAFRTYGEAREFKHGLDAGGSAARKPQVAQTLAEYWPVWLARYRGRTRRGLEDSSRREYRISLQLHVDPLPVAQIKLRDITPPDVKDWLADLERRGCSPTTIRKAKAALSVVLASAAEDGDIPSNPAAGVRYVPSPRVREAHTQPPGRDLTAADVVAILEQLEDQWQTFFIVLVQTGVRIGELLGLTWGHVHLGDDPHVQIVEQVYRGQRKRLKTDASVARVPLSSTAAGLLAELRPPDATDRMPVFQSAIGTPVSYSNAYNRVLRPALQRSGVAINRGTADEPDWDYQRIAFHAFRKACGSLLFARGKTLKQVQGWLRHSQLTTTMNVYINQVDDGLGDADVWDDILTPGGPPKPAGGPHGGPDAASPTTVEQPM